MPARPDRTQTLLGRFTTLTVGIAVVFAAAMSWGLGNLVAHIALEESVAATSQTAESLLSPYLVRGDLLYPLWPQRRLDLERMIAPHLRAPRGGIVTVKLWNRDGAVVFSNDRAQIGSRAAPPGVLSRVLAGDVWAELRRAGPQAGRAPPPATVLTVYVPVRLTGAGQPEGVYEVHRHAGALLQTMHRARVGVWTGVFLGVGILYAALFGVVRRASSSLIEQQHALQAAFEGTIQSLAAALDARDAYIAGHSSRVAHYAVGIAGRLGLSEEDLHAVRLAGYLHDIGKIGIPDRVLGSDRKLAAADAELMRRHSVIGHNILAPVSIDERVKLAVRHNHERWDGSGYPDGLAGTAIPIHARILAVADALEAMTSDRPYRAALSVGTAMAEIRANAGRQFDPAVVDALAAWLRASAPQATGPHVTASPAAG